MINKTGCNDDGPLIMESTVGKRNLQWNLISGNCRDVRDFAAANQTANETRLSDPTSAATQFWEWVNETIQHHVSTQQSMESGGESGWNIVCPQTAGPGAVWRCGGAGQHQLRAGSESPALLALLLLQCQERRQLHGQGRLRESRVPLEGVEMK